MRFAAVIAIWIWAALPAGAALNVNVSASLPAPQPVGTSVTFTAVASGGGSGTLYRFETAGAAGTYALVREFSTANTLPWTTLQEGAYQLRVTAMDPSSGMSGQTVFPYTYNTRITSGAVVSATAHPLVALFSAPPCNAGQVYVQFKGVGDASWQASNTLSCRPGLSLNFYVAGMRAATSYTLQEVLSNNGKTVKGPPLPFTTGTIPFPVPAPAIVDAPDSQTSVADGVLLTAFDSFGAAPGFCALATDLKGNVIWYVPDLCNPSTPGSYLVHPVNGGTYLILIKEQALREVDLAGNLVRETNTGWLNTVLAASGKSKVNDISEDAIRLPGGHTVLSSSIEKILVNQQGPGAVDVIGNQILDLDQNFQLGWTWNAFDHLDTTRLATLNDKCYHNTPICPPFHLANVANFWTSGDSLLYVPDGNLLYSIRNQDWVVKIDYANGTGAGDVIWRMGNQGDFTIQSSDSYPWFTHQDTVSMQGGNLEVFDNGNTRVAANGGGNSRGMVFSVNEPARTVTTLLSADLGVYAYVFGSAFQLSNGNYSFMAGSTAATLLTSNNSFAEEWLPSGTQNYTVEWPVSTLRAFRLQSLYSYTN